MTTQQMVSKLMNTMAEHNCSLLQAESIVTAKHFEQLDTATKMIRTAFERDGKLTINTEVKA